MNALRVVWKMSLVFIGLAVIGAAYHLLIFVPKKTRARLAPKLRPIFPNYLHWVLGLRIRCHGLENLQVEPGKATLLVPNHSSFLDITVLGAAFSTTFVSKHTVAYWPIIGSALWLLGVIYMDRESAEDRLRILVTLGEKFKPGEILTVFPQGGATPDRLRRPFFRGIFKLPEIYPWVTVVPLTIRYTNSDEIAWHQESLFTNVCRLCLRDSIEVDLHVHPALPVEAVAGRRSRAVATQVQQTVFSCLEPIEAPR